MLSLALGISEMSIPKPDVPFLEDLSPMDVFFEVLRGKSESWLRECSVVYLKARLLKFSRRRDGLGGSCFLGIGGL